MFFYIVVGHKEHSAESVYTPIMNGVLSRNGISYPQATKMDIPRRAVLAGILLLRMAKTDIKGYELLFGIPIGSGIST